MSMTVNLTFEKKPTAALCQCHKCRKAIEKGQYRFGILAKGYGDSVSDWFHKDCFLEELWFLMGVNRSEKKTWIDGVYLGIKLATER